MRVFFQLSSLFLTFVCLAATFADNIQQLDSELNKQLEESRQVLADLGKINRERRECKARFEKIRLTGRFSDDEYLEEFLLRKSLLKNEALALSLRMAALRGEHKNTNLRYKLAKRVRGKEEKVNVTEFKEKGRLVQQQLEHVTKQLDWLESAVKASVQVYESPEGLSAKRQFDTMLENCKKHQKHIKAGLDKLTAIKSAFQALRLSYSECMALDSLEMLMSKECQGVCEYVERKDELYMEKGKKVQNKIDEIDEEIRGLKEMASRIRYGTRAVEKLARKQNKLRRELSKQRKVK